MTKKNKTLCKWSKRELHEEFDYLIQIVNNPQFACQDCGRAANKKKWLCEPRDLKESH